MEDVAVVDPESILILPPSPSSPVLTVMCMLPPVPDFGVHGRGFPMCASPLEILMLPEAPSYVGAVDVAVIKPVRQVAATRRRRRHRCTPPSSPLPHPPPPPLPQHATAVTPESFADVVRVCCTPRRLHCRPFAYRAAVIHRGCCSPGRQIPLSLNHVRSARPITWTRSWRSRGRCFVRRGGRCRGKETQTNTESTTSSKRGSDR